MTHTLKFGRASGAIGMSVWMSVFFFFFADIQFCKTALDVSLVKSNVDFMKKKSFLSQDGSRLT